MGWVYRLVCITLRSWKRALFQRVAPSSWARGWQRRLFRLGAHIIPPVTVVPERAVLRLCRRHRVLIRHQPSLYLHLELAYQGSRGRV